ncbi:YihY/virulence factor BrkB family protein [Blastococcus sp. Marseille-P5729]|uniref:YihY/virulence factor BrkB family protein n=1 Tax=Blastococcus sp. Marseille-P5729 TaxID=2086582 RepID=UPI00131B70DC|nr:YhjD/YihY/BrkB family envelope integrity protein [Blastococcus sp. Marseille-P5729]
MSAERLPLRELAHRVEDLQHTRVAPVPDDEAGRWTLRFRETRRRWEWFDHLVITLTRYDRRNGDSYAAAVTFQTFVALVPILLLSASVFGFVLRSDFDRAQKLFQQVAEQIPGGGGDVLIEAMRATEDRAGAIGVLSLLLMIWLGTAWISNMRVAIQRMWGQAPGGGNWFKEKAIDLVVLVGLGIAVLASLALSATASSITEHIVRALGLDDVPGAGVFVTLVATAAAIVANIAILQYLMVSLARQRVSKRAVLRGAVMGAVGFEILKQAGALFIGNLISRSAAAGVFGAVVVLLVWVNVLCRWLLIVVCWTGSSRPVLEHQLKLWTAELTEAAPEQEHPVAGGATPVRRKVD